MVQELLLKECRERSIKVFSAEFGDLVDVADAEEDPTRKMFRQMLGVMAEFEKSNLVRKLRHGLKQKRNRDGWCEGRKPFGTKPEEQAVLRIIMDMRRGGSFFQEIADALNFGNHPYREGKPWNKRRVCQIWHNKRHPGFDDTKQPTNQGENQ